MSASDEFSIWERLLCNVRNEINSDLDGIARNKLHIAELVNRNQWLANRVEANRAAERVMVAAQGEQS